MHTYSRALVALSILALPVGAQSVPSGSACAGGTVRTTLPGGLADEQQRALSIRAGSGWSLTRRSTDHAIARMTADSNPAAVRVAAVLPEIMITSQSAFPLPANDGPMWAGKGLSYSVTGGVALCGRNARWGAIIAPTFWYAENADFALPDDPQIVPPAKGGYSQWASRYYYMPRSLDAPRRFGPTALRRLDLGAITVFRRVGRFEAGFTTQPEWWGPGQYNALLLSSQSAGLPRAYINTTRPFKLAGELDVRYFLGGMAYSPYFFENRAVDTTRTLVGLAAIWRPKFEPNLSLGMARVVLAPLSGIFYPKHALNALLPVGTPNAVGRSDSTQYPGRDQLFSVFANWRLPADGAELWFEWARAELPENLADLLSSPNHTQALTIGVQRVSETFWNDWTWRVGAEFSQTNQSSTYRERPSGSWYTSRAVQAGFSQRGQVIGAMIGPGSVTQRLNLDFASPRRSVGLFAYRVRWDDDSFYTIPRPNGNGLCKHDVSLAYGARGSVATRAGSFDLSLSNQNRLNLYWQALGLCFDNSELQIDKRNFSLEFRFRPALR
ncbi:MAG: hypothetical protein V4813_02405 [Gemmatimonadota bacterium]